MSSLTTGVGAQVPAAWSVPVLERLAGLDQDFAARGYESLRQHRTGALAADDFETYDVTLAANATYLVVGTCDSDCSDLDLVATNTATGAELDNDYLEDDGPVLVLALEGGGHQTVTITVGMAACGAAPCVWGTTLLLVGEGVEVPPSAGSQPGGGVQPASPAALSESGVRVERGVLETGDGTLNSGEWVDRYHFDGQAGDYAILDLRSEQFDPYLMLFGEGEFRQDNDDFQGDPNRSLIRLELPTTTTYQVAVTSYAPGESGGYELEIRVGSGGVPEPSDRVETGALEASDQTLESGEYMDLYTFEGLAGQRVRIDLESSDFDPYLILGSPDESQLENDDADDTTNASRIETELAQSGTYRVLVTSYAIETGTYRMTLRVGGEAVGATPGAPVPAGPSMQNDVTPLPLGTKLSQSLEVGDDRLEGGEWADRYVFEARAGQAVVLEMASQAFDTYLVMDTPGGSSIANDDYLEETQRSRIEMVLPETGRYRVLATSYSADEVGDYSLSLEPTTADAAFAASTGGATVPRRVFGVLVGISDYEGDAGDLAYTAEDALRVQGALIEGAGMAVENSVLLTDQQATLANVRLAVSGLASRMQPDDLFVFFFSGHGDRVPRAEFQPADPDAVDETLVFYDGDLLDDELAELLETVPAGQTLVILDSCFAGGFSKDVISVPGRMGLFSSEEDTTSSVADKFQAGGFLAVFLADAMVGGNADDGDGYLTALELSQYLHERYRSSVKSAPGGRASIFVRTGGPQQGYQHLVVDRGSIGPFDPLFRLQSRN